jgi:hypothetical protein
MRIATLIVGSLTAAYGVLEFVKPDILAKQTEMVGIHPVVADRLRTVSRVLGVRDVISGTAMALASTPLQRKITTAARVAFDLSDGITLAATLPKPAPKAKILLVTGGWAALSAAAGIVAAHTKR